MSLIKNIKAQVKAEATREANKLKKAIQDTKNGVQGAKEKAKVLADDLAKNTAVSPLIPFIPAMLYLLKKEKGLSYSAKQVATKRYVIVTDFYNKIVAPYFKANPSKLSSFDMIEMTSSDFDHVDKEVTLNSEPSTTDSESALQGLFSSAVEGGKQGAKMGAGLGTFLTGVGVPPPIGNIAGAGAGAEYGAIIGGIIKFFKLGLAKVKEALAKTGTKAEELSAGMDVSSEDVTATSSFDFKKLLIPIVAVVVIFVIVKMKK